MLFFVQINRNVKLVFYSDVFLNFLLRCFFF